MEQERERNRLRPCNQRSSGHGSMPSLVAQGSSLRRDPPLVAQGSESALILPAPINRWPWPYASMYDRALHLPSSHSPRLSRAWGRSRPCARHLWGRHLKLSYFLVAPPEGIGTKVSVSARPSTSCRLRREQEQSRSTVVSYCRGWSTPSRSAEPCREGGV